MRLLLDEMYPPVIAHQLRERGRDTEAVTERAELRALSDEELFTLAQGEQRAVVTENIADFSVIADQWDQRGQQHHGLVLVSSGRYPRGQPRTIGLMVTALDRLLGQHTSADPTSPDPTSPRHWL